MFVLLLTEKEVETLKCSLNADFFQTMKLVNGLKNSDSRSYATTIRKGEKYLQIVRDIQIKVDELRRNRKNENI